MQLEHEGDERALEAGAGALEHVEAAARQLDAALEVDDAERLAQLPVWLAPRVAVLLAMLELDLVLVLAASERCGGVRDVR